MDACLAITFGNASRLDVLTNLSGYRITISARALSEVLKPPARDVLWQAVGDQSIEVETVDLSNAEEQHALARFDALPAFRDRGDAEVLALAITRGYLVGSDERAICRIVQTKLGQSHVVSTLDVVVLALRDERLSIDEAEELLERLDVGPAYLRRIKAEGLSLKDLV